MRTSNMPPGLRRYWQTHSRGGGKKHHRKSGGSKAIVRYVPSAPVVRTKTRTIVKKIKSRGGGMSTMKREHGAGHIVPGPFRLKSAAVSALAGYSAAGKGLPQLQELLNKLPQLGKAPKEAIAGLILNYFADRPGAIGEWADAGAQAFIDIGAYKIGEAGFAISGDDDD